MKQNKYNRMRRDGEAGVALIFALALLALLLVMLIGFLASSILEQRIAYNQGSQVGSKLIARSALVRVKSQLATYSDDAAWMRFRPDPAHTKLFAPLVSFGTTAGTLADGDKKTAETEAFQALQPLMEKYVATDNWFPSGLAVDYPDWIYFSASDGSNDRYTGRLAYAVLPNLGIDPTRLGAGGDRPGLLYNELPLAGLNFLTAGGITTARGKTNWLSLDILTGQKGIGKNTDFTTTDVKNEFDSGIVDGKELVNYFFTASQAPILERGWVKDAKSNAWTARTDLSGTLTMAQAQALLGGNFKPADVRDQVAANLVDYLDADHIPTSDVDPAAWETTAGAPSYTGNEKTPYLNQIAPGVEVKMNYAFSRTSNGDGNSTVVQTLTLDYHADVLAELINIYSESLAGGTVTLKDLALELEVHATRNGVEMAGSPVTVRLTKGNTGTVSTVTTQTTAAAVPANGYAFMTLVNTDYPTASSSAFTETEILPDTAPVPEIAVKAAITNISFDRALFKWSSGSAFVDYVGALANTGGQFMEEKFSDAPTVKAVTAYVNFEVNDPRCNLKASEWKGSLGIAPTTMDLVAIPTQGLQNSDADAKNIDIKKAQDVEPESDPAKVSTAYIRDGAMQSPWELGFIHRGQAWQTLNLKSAVDPQSTDYEAKKGGYWDDAALLDRVFFRVETPVKKYNINYPANHLSAFGPLTQGLSYHAVNANPATGSALTPLGAETLSADAAQELRNWIANKCYEAGGTDPAASSAKVYDRYIHRGLLANVIRDWALNGTHSPYKGQDLRDAQLEELAAKIIPLTRCGDAFEYFTVFAVAQSIKDVGGTFHKFNAAGQSTGTQGCTLGSWDPGYDQITSQTYLVARLRREIDVCKNTVNCQNGLHDPECTFKVTVLESYTLSELPN